MAKQPLTFYYTWDHRMNWCPEDPMSVASGFCSPYLKKPETFINEYRKLIDFAADHKNSGVIVFGLLRDSHGGVESANELIRYGKSRGILVLPGISVSFDGGFYHEGTHEFNLEQWLLSSPGLVAVDEHEKPIRPFGLDRFCLCPSKTRNQEWLSRGAKWLLDRLDTEGVYIEQGGLIVCQCSECRANRSTFEGSEDALKHLAMLASPILEVVIRQKKNPMVICSTHLDLGAATYDAVLPLKYFANSVFFEWEFGKSSKVLSDSEGISWGQGRQLGRIGSDPVLWDAGVGLLGGEWARLGIAEIREACYGSSRLKLGGMMICGESGNHEVENELKYLVFNGFAAAPEMEWSDFAKKHLVPAFGSPEKSAAFMDYLLRQETLKRELAKCGGPEERRHLINEILHLAEEIGKMAQPMLGEQKRRWRWLLNSIWGML